MLVLFIFCTICYNKLLLTCANKLTVSQDYLLHGTKNKEKVKIFFVFFHHLALHQAECLSVSDHAGCQ